MNANLDSGGAKSKKVKVMVVASKEQKEALILAFQSCSGSRLDSTQQLALINQTGLTKKWITAWFARERRKVQKQVGALEVVVKPEQADIGISSLSSSLPGTEDSTSSNISSTLLAPKKKPRAKRAPRHHNIKTEPEILPVLHTFTVANQITAQFVSENGDGSSSVFVPYNPVTTPIALKPKVKKRPRPQSTNEDVPRKRDSIRKELEPPYEIPASRSNNVLAPVSVAQPLNHASGSSMMTLLKLDTSISPLFIEDAASQDHVEFELNVHPNSRTPVSVSSGSRPVSYMHANRYPITPAIDHTIYEHPHTIISPLDHSYAQNAYYNHQHWTYRLPIGQAAVANKENIPSTDIFYPQLRFSSLMTPQSILPSTSPLSTDNEEDLVQRHLSISASHLSYW